MRNPKAAVAVKSVVVAVLAGLTLAACAPTQTLVVERVIVQTPDGEVISTSESVLSEAGQPADPAAEVVANPAPAAPAPAAPAPAATEAAGSITRERAAEIALELVNGTLIEVDRDIERGRLVWYVSIRLDGTMHEIYVDRSTGEIVLHERW